MAVPTAIAACFRCQAPTVADGGCRYRPDCGWREYGGAD